MSFRVNVAVGVIATAVAAVGTVAALVAWPQLPPLGANGLLHPSRRPVAATTSATREAVTFAGAGVTLDGWRFPAVGDRRGTIVYLHGVADNRASGLAPSERLARRGFDVIAYDSRAHGNSGGDVCTYGFYEKQDLARVLDTIDDDHGPIVLIGSSLGAAVALQAAAADPRVDAVVAAEAFSDLRTVATERAPWFFTSAVVQRAFVLAERQGQFAVDAVSPVTAAAHIRIPVLLLHGALDRETPPAHSQRIFAALAGPRQLIIVPDTGHNHALTGATWPAIDAWLDDVLMKDRR